MLRTAINPRNDYSALMDRNPTWAMNEGSLFFEDRSQVQISLRRIAERLNQLSIPYAVAGGMALFHHGYRRFTDDIDLLVSSEGLREIHAKLDGLGYVRPFETSKNLRDADNGVRIEFLIAGQYPGDGLAKPVAFPDPDAVSIEEQGIRFLNLPTVVELKLASGMTNPGRLKDLADVQELIRILKLPADFADQLNPYVRPKFQEIWSATPQQESE